MIACSTRHPLLADKLDAVFKEYNIYEYNCLIMDNKSIFEKNDLKNQTKFDSGWLERLVLPILVIKEAEKGKVCQDSTLNCYIPVREMHRSVLLKDVINIPENMPELFPQTNGDVSFYLKQLVKKQFPDACASFCKKTLVIDDTQRWSTQALLGAIKFISIYIDEQNITGYMPAGSKIADLYPTWYVENIYQLAGWFVFRINKHAVLWSVFTDGTYGIISLKFVDLDRTVAVVFPFCEELIPLDAKGNPDLLLSPLALSVLQETFEPDEGGVNYNTTKPEICMQLQGLLGSPYLALYIKELQARIKHAELTGKKEESHNLIEVYNTLFDHSITDKYLTETPLAAINYVSNYISASRFFNLDESSAISIFYSVQKQKYVSIGKDEKDSIVLADRCQIVDSESGEVVWRPMVSDTSEFHTVVERCDIMLPPGRYVVHYKSDDTHSFESWLCPVPAIDDYGIRIYKKNDIKSEVE